VSPVAEPRVARPLVVRVGANKHGGGYDLNEYGGVGAEVTGTLIVRSGQTLTICVGGQGSDNDGNAAPGNGGGGGGGGWHAGEGGVSGGFWGSSGAGGGGNSLFSALNAGASVAKGETWQRVHHHRFHRGDRLRHPR